MLSPRRGGVLSSRRIGGTGKGGYGNISSGKRGGGGGDNSGGQRCGGGEGDGVFCGEDGGVAGRRRNQGKGESFDYECRICFV